MNQADALRFHPVFEPEPPVPTIPRWSGVHVTLQTSYVASEWELGNDAFQMRVQYAPTMALTLWKWNLLRNRWEQEGIPSSLLVPLIVWATEVIHLPLELM